jgi:shikimate dehydrogenase
MRRYGLIGYPLSHSSSPEWWNKRFVEHGLADCAYSLYELNTVAAFPALLAEHPKLAGLNVTIPYKRSVIPYLDALDPVADKIGAVNTIAIRNGKTMGYNTDIEGFRRSIRPFLEPKHDRALLLGTGGAAKAVAYVLEQLGIPVHFASRRSGANNTLSYAELNAAVFNACKLIVNCTPVGMAGHSAESPIGTEYLGPDHFVIDLIYNPAETVLLQQAKERGALTLNGADMLHFQAEAAWEIFGL